MAAGKLVHKPKHTSNNQSIQEQNRTAGTQVSRKSRATGEDVTDPTPKPSQDSDTARWQRSCPGCFIFIVQWKRRHVVHLYIPDWTWTESSSSRWSGFFNNTSRCHLYIQITNFFLNNIKCCTVGRYKAHILWLSLGPNPARAGGDTRGRQVHIG